MKKSYILLVAVATLLAGAACTKVVPTAQGPVEQEVSFEVANYLYRTKAGGENVEFDRDSTFTTYSWFFAPGKEIQYFMSPATIECVDDTWKATDRPYYWPKTGYLHFISYAGKPEPTAIAYMDVDDKDRFVVSYGAYGRISQDSQSDPEFVKIGDKDNAMLASAAFGYYWQGRNDWDQVWVDNPKDPGFFGVPTLFHHLLAKVTIRILVDASGTQDGHSWNLLVNSASFTCADEGILQVPFEQEIGQTGSTYWPWTGNEESVQWEPKMDGNDLALAQKRNPDVPEEGDYSASESSDPIVLWDGVSVLPQLLDPQALSLNLTLTNTFGEETPLVETADLPIVFYQNPEGSNTPAVQPYAFSNTIGAWKMGHHYIYTITIKPNAAVKFDPATFEYTVNEIDYPI